MINVVRITTFLIACVLLLGSIFFVDADHELKMAHLAYRHFDMDQAMRHARRAVLSAGDNTKVEMGALGLEVKIAGKLHREDNALDYLNRMITLSPECASCYRARGDMLYARGMYQKAVDDLSLGLRRSDALSDTKRAYFHARRGLALLELGRTDKAQRDVFVALEMDKSSPRAHFLKSKILRSLGDGKGAIKEARIAYGLGIQKNSFFSSPEGEEWLTYYSLVLLGR